MDEATGSTQPRHAAPSRGVRLRNAVISYLGLLIVFGTFVEKENFRDETKDKLSSIQNAEGIFLVRSQNRKSAVALSALDSRVTEIGAEVHRGRSWWMKSPPSETDVRMMTANMSMVDSGIPTIRESLDNMSVLLDSLGDSSGKHNTELKRIRAQVEDIAKESEQARHLASLKALEDLSGRLQDEIIGIWQATDQLEQSVLMQSRAHKAELKEQLEYYSHVANVLFVIGWVLTLLGRLFGIEALPDAG